MKLLCSPLVGCELMHLRRYWLKICEVNKMTLECESEFAFISRKEFQRSPLKRYRLNTGPDGSLICVNIYKNEPFEARHSGDWLRCPGSQMPLYFHIHFITWQVCCAGGSKQVDNGDINATCRCDSLLHLPMEERLEEHTFMINTI